MPSRRAFLVLCFGVLVVSTASILVRYALDEGVPAISVAALRLLVAVLVLTPLIVVTRREEIGRLAPRDWLLAAAAGAFLALHFASWIASLEYTSVASSVVLVTTNPIWVGIASWLFLGERFSRAMMSAIALAIAGSAVIFLADQSQPSQSASNPWLGNSLATLGALAMCGYLLIGRRLRARISLLAYIGVVYAVAALLLMASAAAVRAPLSGISATAWMFVIALALGPQLLGHSSLNWSLKHFPATTVAVAILGEPIGTTLLAWWLLDETLSATKLAGMLLLLAGIFVAARSGKS